jgi:hypothetical protein
VQKVAVRARISALNRRLRAAMTRRSAAVAVVAIVACSVGAAGAYAAVTLSGGSGGPGGSGGSGGSAKTSGTVVSTTGFPSGKGEPGIFTDRCAYSHEAPDDAILAFGLPGTSMHHDFYGNTMTTASSTAASLVGGATTCTTSADASAYWSPVLYQHGTALKPGPALIYWRKPAGDSSSVHTVPAGLQLIAGNEGATAPQGTQVVAWGCSGKQQGRRSATPQDCPSGQYLRVTVTFPSCWDGHTLVGARQLNVVYRTATGCPAGHAVQIPQIVFHVTYPTSSASGLTLSMSPTMQGSTDTMHVDFMNGWTQATLDRDVAACTATSTRCGPVTGPAATPQGPADNRR